MQEVNVEGLDDLNDRLTRFLQQAPEMRREFHERVGDVMQREVQKNVGAALNDSRGRIAGWQRKYVGSGGGYAAVRAEDTSTGRHSPGAITNYLENGHRIRTAGTTAIRKRASRAKVQYVAGRFFYLKTRLEIRDKLEAEAEGFVEQLARLLED